MKTPTWWPRGVLTPADMAHQLRHHPIRSLFFLCLGGGIGWVVGRLAEVLPWFGWLALGAYLVALK